MKIAFLHITMGVVERGSEAVLDTVASMLAQNHEVVVIQAGIVKKSSYTCVRTMKMSKSPKVAPENIFEKILFRLSLDPLSTDVAKFTHQSLDAIAQFDPDIIIPFNGAGQLSILKKHFPHKKFVVFGHAGVGFQDKKTLSVEPDVFIALSSYAKQWATKHARKKTEVVYIPNPINLETFNKAKAKNIPLQKPIIISVGALTAYKNHDLVIQAVAKTKASLLILGKGEQGTGLRALAKIVLPGRHMIINVDQGEIAGYYKGADVFCLMPDPQESFGMVYLEAMAASLPIVAPKDQIRKSILGKNGIFASYEVKDIARKIGDSFGKKPINYQAELKKYDHHTIVEKIDTLLSRVGEVKKS